MFRKYGYSIGGIGHEISGISSLLALSNVPSPGTSTYVKFSQTLLCLTVPIMLAFRITSTLTMSKEFTITSELVVTPKVTYHDRKFMRILFGMDVRLVRPTIRRVCQ
jgi:hypothetical protein